MCLQTVLPDPLRIGKVSLHRHNPGSAHLGSFLDNKVRARLLDRREEKPKIRRIDLWPPLRLAEQNTAPFACLTDLGQPLTITAIEHSNLRPNLLAHHAKKIVRLRFIQSQRLPRPQRVIYKQSDLHICHRPKHMSSDKNTPEQNGQVSDAVKGNWVDSYAPLRTRPYLRLSRADRPIGTWLLLIPCWWGLLLAMLHDRVVTWHDLWIFVACAAGAFLMRGAGCTWNDITDRDFDGAVERTRSRPIPSGQVTARQAAVWMCFQALIAFGILLTFNTAAVFLGVLALVPVAIYPFAKRFTWWPQVFLGLAFNWGALLAWTAHRGALEAPALYLYVAGIVWTLFYDTIYAHQDTEDDALIGIKSTARLFGTQSPMWLARFLAATVTLLGIAILGAMLGSASGPIALVIALVGACVMGWHMLWQLNNFAPDDSTKLIKLFRSNRDAGLIPLLFFAVALLV